MAVGDLAVYRHYKGGFYRVICEAKMESEDDFIVVYEAWPQPRSIWARPVKEFWGVVEHEGNTVRRFASLEGWELRQIVADGLKASNDLPGHAALSKTPD